MTPTWVDRLDSIISVNRSPRSTQLACELGTRGTNIRNIRGWNEIGTRTGIAAGTGSGIRTKKRNVELEVRTGSILQ